MVQSIIIKVGAGQHPDRHGTGGPESSTSLFKGREEKTDFQKARSKVSKSTRTHFLQQGHTNSSKATPTNSAISWAKYIQTTIGLNSSLSPLRLTSGPSLDSSLVSRSLIKTSSAKPLSVVQKYHSQALGTRDSQMSSKASSSCSLPAIYWPILSLLFS